MSGIFLTNHHFSPRYFFLFSFFMGHFLWAQNNPWATRAALPLPRVALSSTVFNDQIYAIGGVTEGSEADEYGCGAIPTPKMHVYDPVSDTWDTIKAAMHTGRNSFASCLLNGKIYAIGGQSISCYENLASIEVYDPLANTWDTTKAAMPEKRAGISASVVNDRIYVFGGWNYTAPNSKRTVLEYDPQADQWETKKQMPAAAPYLTTSVVGEKIYAFGGQIGDDGFDSHNRLQIYDPASDSWDTTKTAMPAARSFLKSAAVNNIIYIFGGTTNFYEDPPMDNVWAYNTDTDTYKVLTSMPEGIVHSSIGAVNGRIYLIGGCSNVWPPDQVQFIQNVLEYNPDIDPRDSTINVPEDQPTIQSAIDSSGDGGLVLVAEGTYYENINFKGKKITVASHYYLDGDTSHITNTIINGSQPSNPDSGSVVYFVSGEDTTSVLTGFTITGGTGTSIIAWTGARGILGGGILILWSGAKIENNRIINNNITATAPADTGAAGIAIFANGEVGDYLVIRDNLISKNSATADVIAFGTVYWGMKEKTVFEGNVVSANVINADFAFGGGLAPYGFNGWQGAYIIRNNIVKNNILNATRGSAGGGLDIANCSPQVTNNIITGNSSINGGGVNVRHTTFYTGIPSPVFINNTISKNSAANYGGGIFVHGSSQAKAIVMNTIIWGNSAPDGPQIEVYDSASISVQYSDVQGGWEGIKNIDSDPLFADSLLYELAQSSPCVGAGVDSLQLTGTWYHAPPFDCDGDPRPNPVDDFIDIGAQESPFITGIIKENTDYLPNSFSLKQNYPNPFNPRTTIEFSIPNTVFVRLKIYNLLGQELATLISEKLVAGNYKYEWYAGALASGIYYYKLEAGSFIQTKKLILLK